MDFPQVDFPATWIFLKSTSQSTKKIQFCQIRGGCSYPLASPRSTLIKMYIHIDDCYIYIYIYIYIYMFIYIYIYIYACVYIYIYIYIFFIYICGYENKLRHSILYYNTSKRFLEQQNATHKVLQIIPWYSDMYCKHPSNSYTESLIKMYINIDDCYIYIYLYIYIFIYIYCPKQHLKPENIN